MERKLASIQKIEKLEPIKDADAIEKATILGWHLVVKKGEFKEGDTCVYCEVDSVLPERPEFEFLRPRHFRIKTIKLRGQVSQGIAFPMSVLPPGTYPGPRGSEKFPTPGDDVTEALGVVKYEPAIPAQLAGVAKGNFPGFLHKTDEIRIQSVPQVVTRYQDKKFYVTEKIDGSSMTVYLRNMDMGGEFGVCSRNLDLKEEGETAFWKAARNFDLEAKMRAISKEGPLLNLALQGELIGNGIQKNKYNLPGHEFYVFNVYDIDKAEYMASKDLYTFCQKWGLKHVPLISSDYSLPKTVDELVEFSKGKSVLNKAAHREGLVFRPQEEVYDEDLHRLSFKVINPDFLLKNDE